MFQYQQDSLANTLQAGTNEYLLPDSSIDNSKGFNPHRAKKNTKINSQNRKIYDLNIQASKNTSPTYEQ